LFAIEGIYEFDATSYLITEPKVTPEDMPASAAEILKATLFISPSSRIV
jgi:hypothetical protein